MMTKRKAFAFCAVAAALLVSACASPLAIAFEAPPATATTTTTEELSTQQLFAPVWESRELLRSEYVEQPVEDSALARGALKGLASVLEDEGLLLSEINVGSGAPSAEELATQAQTPEEAAQDFAAFWEAWRKVTYGDIAIAMDDEELVHTVLAFMVDELGDPHTAYMDPRQFEQSTIQLEGQYDGIGAFVDIETEYVTITSPMPDSPAERAGLQPGDLVIAVDGQDMTDVPGSVVLTHILGPAGSPVVLTIRRGSQEPFDVEIIREHISVPSVEGEMLDNNVAYIQLNTFGGSTATELREILETLLAEDPDGVILDLRNNGGGYLYTAVAVASEFIADGAILYEEYGNGESDAYYAIDGGLATTVPLVVLVNGGTASASEILAGAIQDYDRGVLVGETTYGKGSVQQPEILANDQGALRITIAHWLTPDHRLIHGEGLTPDYAIALTEQDYEQQLDPQLDKAVELISAQANTTN